MILLLSPIAEKTTNDVIDWFLYWNIPFVRITDKTEPDIELYISDNHIDLSIVGAAIETISAFWVRKGDFVYNTQLNSIPDILKQTIDSYLEKEFHLLVDYIVFKLEQKKRLGNYFESNPNKLLHLQIARDIGLQIPKTYITQTSYRLIDIFKKNGKIINKSIKDSFTLNYNGIYYYNHTEQVEEEIVNDMPPKFFPSLVQEELLKEYELRIVFVNDILYTMAIFSQSDDQTKVDWRNYNYQKPSRLVPYKLPEGVTFLVKKFIQTSGLNTGAIDMVVTKDKRYVFLECNPNGQISMVSEQCNYPIEKYIASYLCYD
ncbi:grasp-with-spasm system ATP-grasp peptide maturase [Larkinella sp. GY13]|uniref:grasp-with-spasm system ATP-grasp peptide maturase n=1 Tax=Larkinella sp. GY13 TaxID=3453720 RepID=UPI003EE92684